MNHHELYCHQNRWQPQWKERSKQFVDKITQRSLFRFLTFYSDCLVSRGPYKLYSCIQSIQSHFILIINIQADGQRTISPNSVCLYCLAIFFKSKTNKIQNKCDKVWLVSLFSDGGLSELCLSCRSSSNSSAALYGQCPWLQHRQ